MVSYFRVKDSRMSSPFYDPPIQPERAFRSEIGTFRSLCSERWFHSGPSWFHLFPSTYRVRSSSWLISKPALAHWREGSCYEISMSNRVKAAKVIAPRVPRGGLDMPCVDDQTLYPMPPIVRPRRCLRHVPLARDDLRSFCPERLRLSARDEGDRGPRIAIKNADVSMDTVALAI